MPKLLEIMSDSVEDTMAAARDLAKSMIAGDVIALYGPVGAGKTCFVKGLAAGLKCKTLVRSPSFNLVNEYDGDIPLYHIDFYRLTSDAEIGDLGWTDYLNAFGIVVIEWAEKVKNSLPEGTIEAYFSILGENLRKLEIYAGDDFRNRQFR